jgi:hypothetical protein
VAAAATAAKVLEVRCTPTVSPGDGSLSGGCGDGGKGAGGALHSHCLSGGWQPEWRLRRRRQRCWRCVALPLSLRGVLWDTTRQLHSLSRCRRSCEQELGQWSRECAGFTLVLSLQPPLTVLFALIINRGGCAAGGRGGGGTVLKYDEVFRFETDLFEGSAVVKVQQKSHQMQVSFSHTTLSRNQPKTGQRPI